MAETPRAADAVAASDRPRGAGDLWLRVVSAAALAPVALAVAYAGGWPFALFWTGAGVVIWWEWIGLVAGGSRGALVVAGGLAIAAAALLVAEGRPGTASLVLLPGIMSAVLLAPPGRRAWSGAGVLYAGAVALFPVLLRRDVDLGLVAILLLFAIVWTTDIVAYFAGRRIGGPKLWPRVSPKKTWSGAVAGTLAGVAAGLGVARLAGLDSLAAVAALGLVLSIVSQAGDLFESSIKRRFGAKDASRLIPGHGGLLDRLDGFVAAAAAAVLIGVWRGGLEAPSRGLLIW